MSRESSNFNPEAAPESFLGREPCQLSYAEFLDEYERVMRAVAEKEKKGRLDPQIEPYEPVTEEEQRLLESDWKEFSRRRGFSEEDIMEYERWLALSGQRDSLSGAINDPWRRPRSGHEQSLYIAHIQKGLDEDREVPPKALENYNALIASQKSRPQHPSVDIPATSQVAGEGEDVW